MAKISVALITYNEEENIKDCLKSVQWADEIVVVDGSSKDKTREIAKAMGARVIKTTNKPFFDTNKNIAIRACRSDWILSLDADEEIPLHLAKILQDLAQDPKDVTYFRLPRKNIIFGKWIKHCRWWPDYNIRFFKKDCVRWAEKIHSVPLTRGAGSDLEAKEANAIIHHHYQSIFQYLERMNRYTGSQAEELIKTGYKFHWQDMLRKPTGEFLSRFFVGEAYKDGLRGLVLALLQAFSEMVKYIKVWEKEKFVEQDISTYHQVLEENINDYLHWQVKASGLIGKIRLKIKKKI